MSNGEWEDISLPDIIKFDTFGDHIEGTFIGRQTIPADKPFEVLIFEEPDGNRVQTAASGGLGPVFANITEGTYVRVEYISDRDTGKPSPMKEFKVQKRG